MKTLLGSFVVFCWVPQALAQSDFYTGSLKWTLGSVLTGPAAESTNVNNEAYRTPTEAYASLMRAEAKFRINTRLTFVIRPFFNVWYQRAYVKSAGLKRGNFRIASYLNEGFGSATLDENAQFSYGLQVYNWGPAELITPSNPFFYEANLERSNVLETRGRMLSRLNLTWGKNVTFTAMAEPDSNGASTLPGDRKFDRRALARLELSDDTQTNYVGLTGGGGEKSRPFFGGYFNLEAFEGFSIYADALVRQGSEAYYPKIAAPLQPQVGVGVGAGAGAGAGGSGSGAVAGEFVQSEVNSKEVYPLAVGGLRYAFENGADLRLEGLYEHAGYTKMQKDDALTLALEKSPNLPQNLAYYRSNGTLLTGRRFSYVSLRKADWGYKNGMSLSLRALTSLSDSSSRFLSLFESSITDSMTLLLYFSYAHGAQDTELNRGSKYSVTLGETYAW